MNKVYGFAFLFIISVLLCSCSNGDSKSLEKKHVDQIENDIVFICNWQQYSDGYVNRGFFIDKFGNKVFFDLSAESQEYANINVLYTYLTENYQECEFSPYIEENKMLECYNYLLKIDANADVSEENEAVDYGMGIIYGIRVMQGGKYEIIMLEEFGDFKRHNLDENVGPIMDILHDWKELLIKTVTST